LRVTDDVSFAVAAGELHALIGPNGAGKTTLIHQLSGTVPPEGGRMLFAGEDIGARTMAGRVELGLARSFQITSVLPRFTALANVAMAVQARSGSSFRFLRAADREEVLNAPARGLLQRVGLADRANVEAGLLSHGEKRVLEIAIALATAPRLLLLDEPLAGTSHAESRRLVELLRGLKGEVAILLVEHDMEAVFALADRISVLCEGRLIASGTPEAIRADPAVRAAYLGEDAA
jgi:branched-chain amino acid transport system ATP-binding protein